MKNIIVILTLSILAAKASPIAPESVAVLYNSNIPQSMDLAAHYAQMRKIPMENLIGIQLTERGQISRSAYNTSLRDPLRNAFSARGWWTLGRTAEGMIMPATCKISTLVCMRGIPFKIAREVIAPNPTEPSPKPKTPFAQSNEASVDSELAMMGIQGIPTEGPLNNPYFKKDQSFASSKLPIMLLVGRIDGPSYEICKRMINDAVATESRGLWGMCYVDIAKKGGGYASGDEWLENIAELNFFTGIPTVIDRNKQTFTTNYPMNDAALYYGWYTKHRNGSLLNEQFQFRQGAVATHLHSFSASNLRDSNSHWSGPILAKGAAATLGNVYEPYLHLTHHLDVFHDRLIKGFSLVEAAYMAAPVLSWQHVVLGDPLYRPFLHLNGSGELAQQDRDYRAIRLAHENWGKQPDTLVQKLRTAAAAKNNGKLYEYLGLWHRQQKDHKVAIAFFDSASKKHIKESDQLRQWLYTADIHRETGNKRTAIAILRQVSQMIPAIPESKTIVALLNILDPPAPPPAKLPAAGTAEKKTIQSPPPVTAEP
ncbi:MAG: TIGR03790 family protein [Akkermansiaceae bacterium]|nr:TIGR03790 family protein [Akkermansiaceae bacterium]